jgi:UDP:flavonoid glycosyltransferase YjiC (YdhE family)
LPRPAIPPALRHPGIARAEMAGRAGTTMVGELFGRANLSLVGPLQELAGRIRPELIVYEPLAEAGALVAGRLGVPSVLQENTLWPATELLRAVSGSSAMRRHRLPEPELVITVTPPSVGGARVGRPMRPVPWSGGGDVPDWLLRPGDRPRILVSRSTLPGGPRDGDPSAAVVAAADRVDAEFVLARPPDRVAKRRLPPNVRVVGRVPLDVAMPHAAGYVHHGGAGSVLNGLAAGVPQLVVPGPGDRRHNAGLVERRGAGLAVAANAIGPEHLTRLISDGGLRAAAQEVSAEIAAMPDPATLVPELTGLVRT